MGKDHRDYERIEKAIQYLNRHCDRQPSLAEVAQSAHLSEFHFQRVFKRWAGISPKRFLQFLTAERRARVCRVLGASGWSTTLDAKEQRQQESQRKGRC